MTSIAGARAKKAVVSLLLQVFSLPLPLPGLVAAPLLPQVAPGAPRGLRGEVVALVGARRLPV